jgi:hypothetical protein
MITIALLIAGISTVVIVTVIALLRAGIAREESDWSLRHGPATRASALTRRMVRLYVRMPSAHAHGDGDESAQSPDSSSRRWPGDNTR